MLRAFLNGGIPPPPFPVRFPFSPFRFFTFSNFSKFPKMTQKSDISGYSVPLTLFYVVYIIPTHSQHVKGKREEKRKY